MKQNFRGCETPASCRIPMAIDDARGGVELLNLASMRAWAPTRPRCRASGRRRISDSSCRGNRCLLRSVTAGLIISGAQMSALRLSAVAVVTSAPRRSATSRRSAPTTGHALEIELELGCGLGIGISNSLNSRIRASDETRPLEFALRAVADERHGTVRTRHVTRGQRRHRGGAQGRNESSLHWYIRSQRPRARRVTVARRPYCEDGRSRT